MLELKSANGNATFVPPFALNRTMLELKYVKYSPVEIDEVVSQSYHVGIEIRFLSLQSNTTYNSQSYHVGIEIVVSFSVSVSASGALNRTMLELK